MKRHLVTRYQPWMSEVPADTGQVPLRSLVLSAAVPLVLLSSFTLRFSSPLLEEATPQPVFQLSVSNLPIYRGNVWYPNQVHSIQEPDATPHPTTVFTRGAVPHLWGVVWSQSIPNLAADPAPDRLVPSFSLIPGYEAPHKWGQALLTSPFKSDDKFSPLTSLRGSTAPHLWGQIYQSHPLQDNGPERSFPNSLYLKGVTAPNKDGYLWFPAWGGGAKGEPIPRVAQRILTSPQLPIGPRPFVGSVQWLSRSSILDDAEHQLRSFNRFFQIYPELNDLRRRQPGSVWTTNLGGRQDPSEGQEKPSFVSPTSSQFPGQLLPRGFVWQPQRPIQLFDMRPIQASMYLPGFSYPRMQLKGFVWTSLAPRDETSQRHLSVYLSDSKPRYGGSIWQSQIPKLSDRLAPSLVVSAASFHFPGKITLTGLKRDIPSVPRVVIGYLISTGRTAPIEALTGRKATFYKSYLAAAFNPADYYWKAGDLQANWTLELVGNTECTQPWATTLTEGWIIGKLTL